MDAQLENTVGCWFLPRQPKDSNERSRVPVDLGGGCPDGRRASAGSWLSKDCSTAFVWLGMHSFVGPVSPPDEPR